jgi:hypothetical protein
VSDRRLIHEVDTTWKALEELGKETEAMVAEEAVVVGE